MKKKQVKKLYVLITKMMRDHKMAKFDSLFFWRELII